MLTIVCVLKSGGDYTPEYAERLYEGVRTHCSVPYEFVCLTDMEVDCPSRSLLDTFPGWWSKLEVFRLVGKILYIDLDSKILGKLDQFSEIPSGQFYMLRDFYRGNSVGSGIMLWNGDFSWIYKQFLNIYGSSEVLPRRGPGVQSSEGLQVGGKLYRGDQDYLKDRCLPGLQTKILQDTFSGIYSYKVHCLETGVPADATVVCFHGKPRPHEVLEGPLSW